MSVSALEPARRQLGASYRVRPLWDHLDQKSVRVGRSQLCPHEQTSPALLGRLEKYRISQSLSLNIRWSNRMRLRAGRASILLPRADVGRLPAEVHLVLKAESRRRIIPVRPLPNWLPLVNIQSFYFKLFH